MTPQRINSRRQQRGLSFIGVIFVGLFIVCAFAIGGQSIPIFIEYLAIKKAAAKAARDGTTVPEVRAAFDRAAQIDDIQSVAGKDLEVSKRNDKIVVSFSYAREIALAGPAFLVYRFQDSTQP